MSAIIEDLFNKIKTHKGIEVIITCDSEGVPIKSNLDDENKTYLISTAVSTAVKKFNSAVKDITEEELKFIRIRTKTNEIMISYETDFIFIVIQNPSSNN